MTVERQVAVSEEERMTLCVAAHTHCHSLPHPLPQVPF